MTRNKDFKAIVRTRMRRTGESYTVARAAVAAIPSPSTARSEEAARRQRLLVERWFVGGQLRSIPSRRKIRAAVLLEVLSRCRPGRIYTEQQISRLLQQIHPDFATIRRELVGLGYLERSLGLYWVCAAAPVRSDQQRRELPAWEEIWLPGFVADQQLAAPMVEVGR